MGQSAFIITFFFVLTLSQKLSMFPTTYLILLGFQQYLP